MILREAEAHASLTRLSQLKIDAFQISVGSEWRRSLRRAVTITAIVCSLSISAGSMWHSADDLKDASQLISVLLYSAIVGFAAAFIAMFLRDIVAIVENRRRRA